jgi:tripartite-type tricarboxylate transporter receptor subunit TctC
MKRYLASITTIAALFTATSANAQSDYPNKPVKVVVTVPAGGGVDTVTRLVTERLRNVLGQPFVVENKGGAGGNIAADSVFQSPRSPPTSCSTRTSASIRPRSSRS